VAALTLRRVVWTALPVVLAGFALAPYAFMVTGMAQEVWRGLPAALLAGLVGWLPRRRWSDAGCLALPLLAADSLEPGVGAAALVCLALPVHALTQRPRFAVLFGGSLLAALLIGIQLKTRFAGSRLTWPDIAFFFAQFQGNLGVVRSQPTVGLVAAGAIAAFVLAMVAGWWWDGRAAARDRRWGPAWLPPALACVLVAGCAWSLRGPAQHATSGQLDAHAETPADLWRLAHVQGWSARPISTFLATVALTPHWTPRDVDTSAFGREVRALAAASASASRPADVLVFLQESQFNPAALEGCPPALCRMPVFEGDAATRAAGPLRVHVFGAGTWLSEFTLATGIPHTAFGEAGAFAPFNVAPGTQASFVRSMRAAGYRTAAIYPTRGGMMNGRAAYAAYGFDRFDDAVALGLDGAFSTSDEAMHRAALRVLEEERAHGQPVLLFVATIFNHGEHGVKMERVPQDLRRQVRGAVPDAKEADSLADYLWRTQEFQRVMQRTRREVLNDPRPAVIAWYGDHQPAFGSATALRDRVRPFAVGVPPRMFTWYEIASSRLAPQGGADAAAVGKRSTAPVDIAFLPGLLAQAAGVRLDPWLAANVRARDGCDGLFEECREPAVRDAYLSFLWRDLHAFELP
jgi:hypothetical protein